MLFFKKFNAFDLTFEDAIGDEWTYGEEVVEVPLSRKPFFAVGVIIVLAVAGIALRVVGLNILKSDMFQARATSNLSEVSRVGAPRGLIEDRYGNIIVQNKAEYAAVLNVEQYLNASSSRQSEALDAAATILGVAREDVAAAVAEREAAGVTDPMILQSNLTQNEVVALKARSNPLLSVVSAFERDYPDGPVYSSVIGYTSLASAADLKSNPGIASQDMVGKAGIEAYYDNKLRGTPGVTVRVRDARGQILGEAEKSVAAPGGALNLTIDAEFQKYFYERMREGLATLGRTAGGGLAINPQTGEVLALVSFPTYDNGAFSLGGDVSAKRHILTSAGHPLFNRVTSGLYNPGSTIKPLVAVATLAEHIIDPLRQIFSPGYLDIPNPYNPDRPSQFLDWRYQGNVDLYKALAYSSNVYFYSVGGGANGITGLGISRLLSWWQKFRLGQDTGVDLPGEASGFLPTPDWKTAKTGHPWLLGDTFNVSIGQGDLLVTPLQLLSYIGAIGNGGTVYRPYLARDLEKPQVSADLTPLLPEIREVQKGMREAVTNPMGTAFKLNDLPFPVAAKTGSAQVKNNTQENAFFVGYLPAEALAQAGAPLSKQIAILVLIENSKEGSLNAVPIARDVLNWYWEHRLTASHQ